MIGRGLKKYAAEIGLKVDKGVAYGMYKGYMLTLKEGAGWKSVTFAIHLTDESEKATLHMMLDDPELKKQYRISGHSISDVLICVTFLDNPGTLSRLTVFTDMLCEKLASRSVPGDGYCNCCGLAMDPGASYPVIINKNVFTMHSGCIDKITEESNDYNQQVQKNGNLLTGTLGAVIGGLVGAIPWAVAYYFGWFVGWLGFLIGLAAKKGYELFKGKETKAKAVIIIIVTVLAVVAAEYITCLISLMAEISADPELSYLDSSVSGVDSLIRWMFEIDAEFRSAIITDVLVGWLFAGLGIFSTIREIFSATSAASSVPERLEKKE